MFITIGVAVCYKVVKEILHFVGSTEFLGVNSSGGLRIRPGSHCSGAGFITGRRRSRYLRNWQNTSIMAICEMNRFSLFYFQPR